MLLKSRRKAAFYISRGMDNILNDRKSCVDVRFIVHLFCYGYKYREESR